MQIVIDIPKWFKEMIDKGEKPPFFPLFLAYGIQQGIVLPEGHGDLIDRDALRESMHGACMGVMAGSDSYDAPLKTLDSATVVIEADREVKDGR